MNLSIFPNYESNPFFLWLIKNTALFLNLQPPSYLLFPAPLLNQLGYFLSKMHPSTIERSSLPPLLSIEYNADTLFNRIIEKAL